MTPHTPYGHLPFTPAQLARFGWLSGAALLFALGVASASADPVPALTFDDGRGSFEFVERLRFEDRSNNFDFDSSAHSPTDDSWWVQRVRLGVAWQPDPRWSLQAQLQDAREWDSERPNVPFILGSEGNDPLDLRLASVSWGNPKTTPVQFTLGRQTLAFGDERLVGVSEWNNFARTFDAAKLVWPVVPARVAATAFVASVVNIRPTTSGQGWKFDRSSTDDLFSGVYVSNKPDAADTLDLYALWRDKKNNDPIYTAPTAAIPAAARSAAAYDIAQNVYTLGTRFVRAPREGAFDGEFEAAWQGGHVERQTTSAIGPYAGDAPQLEQRAWALHTLVGYSPSGAPAKLRLDAEYNLASGDSHRSDNVNGSFMSLFPSNHPYYGYMDLFSWKNLEEWVATVRCSPLPDLTLRVDYHDFSLFTTSDAWYRANGVTAVRPLNDAARAAPRSVGNEIDVSAGWTPVRWARFDLGWSRFKAGSYLQATGAHSDARLLYVQTTLKL